MGPCKQRPHTLCGIWPPGRLWRPFWAPPVPCAPGPFPGAVPSGPAAPQPLAGPRSGRRGPRFARRGRGCLACPPFPRSGTCAPGPLPRLRGRSLPPSALALPSLRCGLPFRSALLRLLRGRWAARRLTGGSLRPRCRGFGPGCSPRGPLAACGRLFSPSGPRGFFAARPGLPGLAAVFRGCRHGRRVLPCAPRPPPPLGAPGAWGPFPGRRFSHPSSRGPPRPGGPRGRIFGPVHFPEIVNHTLTPSPVRGIFEAWGPFPLLRGLPSGIHGRGKPLGQK